MNGLRVIDLSRLLPGPFATLCMQGLGAQVVKVEDPDGGDLLRHIPPTIGEHGAWFTTLNRGKRSVALNLREAEGRRGLHALLADADVLVESFRPGVMGRLGFDPLTLRHDYPRLVIASLTGWGQSGPYAALPGHDLGFLSIAGMLGADPTVPRMQWADLAAGGLVAALRVASALIDRGASGHGAWLDIAMLDGLIGLQQTQFAQLAAGVPPDELLTGGASVYGLYRCQDGVYVSVAALEARFRAVLEAATEDVSAEGLARLFGGAPSAHWAVALGGACVVPVRAFAEVHLDPHIACRNLFVGGLAHPPTGPVHGAVPRLGEHTEAELSRVGYRAE